MAEINLPKTKTTNKRCSFENCKNPWYCRDLCATHYYRLKKYGAMDDGVHLRLRILKFWGDVALTANPDKCWEWQGYIRPSGYGAVSFKNVWFQAHRLAWYFTHNKMPTLCILHSCDNRRCVNPNHLREGTYADNYQDMRDRGRNITGSKHINAKLKESDIPDILRRLRLGESQAKIALTYNIAQQTISKIKRGLRWKISAAIGDEK